MTHQQSGAEQEQGQGGFGGSGAPEGGALRKRYDDLAEEARRNNIAEAIQSGQPVGYGMYVPGRPIEPGDNGAGDMSGRTEPQGGGRSSESGSQTAGDLDELGPLARRIAEQERLRGNGRTTE